MQNGRRGVERALGIDDHGERIVVHPDEIGGVLGHVAVLGHDHCHRLADEPDAVRRRAVVVDRRRHADREGLGVPGDVRAGESAVHAVQRQRLRQIVAADRRVRQRRAHDRRVAHVADRRVVVDVGSAPGEEPRVLDALDRLPDPASLAHYAPASTNGTLAFFATARSWSMRSSGIGTPCSSRSFLFARSGSPATSTG